MTSTAKIGTHDKKVFDLLRRQNKPLSAYQILNKLHDAGLRAPTTVYRALTALTKLGLVHRIESLNAYVACTHHDKPAHAGKFAICTNCGTAEELDTRILAPAMQKAGKTFLTTIHNSVLEISGVCRKCAARTRHPAS
ncbi:MAG: Fur family transcriptional regulator [Alphaproteobacteria bacterium]